MLIRKNGETDKEFCNRLEYYAKDLEAKLIKEREKTEAALKIPIDANVINPRTKRLYKDEAQLLFTTVALTEDAIRSKMEKESLIFLRECLDQLGFSLVDIYEGKATKENAYNG
jgi:hypothetical protein